MCCTAPEPWNPSPGPRTPSSIFFHLTHPGIKVLALWTAKAVLNLGQGSLHVDAQGDLFWVSAHGTLLDMAGTACFMLPFPSYHCALWLRHWRTRSAYRTRVSCHFPASNRLGTQVRTHPLPHLVMVAPGYFLSLQSLITSLHPTPRWQDPRCFTTLRTPPSSLPHRSPVTQAALGCDVKMGDYDL